MQLSHRVFFPSSIHPLPTIRNCWQIPLPSFYPWRNSISFTTPLLFFSPPSSYQGIPAYVLSRRPGFKRGAEDGDNAWFFCISSCSNLINLDHLDPLHSFYHPQPFKDHSNQDENDTKDNREGPFITSHFHHMELGPYVKECEDWYGYFLVNEGQTRKRHEMLTVKKPLVTHPKQLLANYQDQW